MTTRAALRAELRGLARRAGLARLRHLGRTSAPQSATPSPASSPSVPGSRRASMFFDDYQRFYDSSQTGTYHGRLNLRYEAIFAENRDLFRGARVLDISSHDGRWSLAALSTGARSVVGVEARPELVGRAEENFESYGIDPGSYRFVIGDVFDVLRRERIEVDLVLCLGFLYHTQRYNELMFRIRQCAPRHLLVDTEVHKGGGGPVVHLRTEGVDRQGNAVVDEFADGDTVLCGRPTMPALRVMMRAYGFEVERLSDWDGLIRDNPDETGIRDYAQRNRVTCRCRATTVG